MFLFIIRNNLENLYVNILRIFQIFLCNNREDINFKKQVVKKCNTKIV